MSRALRYQSPTGYYHIMVRGAGKQIIFEDDYDCQFYLSRIAECVKEKEYDLVAYCIMINHVHLLLRADSKENISKLMQKVGSAYAVYFNNKYEHIGHVFQGRYKGKLITSESYFLTCIRYIHNNPAKANISSRENYRWSSYREYVQDNGVTNRAILYDLIGGKNQFIRFSDIKDSDEDISSMMDCRIVAKPYEEGLAVICSCLGESCQSGLMVKILRKPERNKILRKLKQTGLSVKQIEKLTGVSKSIIYRALNE